MDIGYAIPIGLIFALLAFLFGYFAPNLGCGGYGQLPCPDEKTARLVKVVFGLVLAVLVFLYTCMIVILTAPTVPA